MNLRQSRSWGRMRPEIAREARLIVREYLTVLSDIVGQFKCPTMRTGSHPWSIELTARARTPGRSIHVLIRDSVGFWSTGMFSAAGLAVQLEFMGLHVVVSQHDIPDVVLRQQLDR